MKKFLTLIYCLAAFTLQAQTYLPPVIQWQRCIGGSSHDRSWDIAKADDGGYVIIGKTQCTDGDATGNPYSPIALWVLKLDSMGNIIWKHFFPLYSATPDNFNIQQTADLGYIFGGDSITKLDQSGNIQWQHPSPAVQVIQTLDGGYAGALGYHVRKLDNLGNHEWLYWCYTYSELRAFIQLPDSSFLIGGDYPDVGSVTEVFRMYDTVGPCSSVFLMMGQGTPPIGGMCNTFDNGYVLTGGFGTIKRDNSDSDIWTAVEAYGVSQANDSSILLAGSDQTGDATIIKLSNDGDSLWTKSCGGTNDEHFRKVIQTNDGGYIAIGTTASNDGDVSSNHGMSDIWVVKFGPDSLVNLAIQTVSAQASIDIHPNPTNGNFIFTTSEAGSVNFYDLKGSIQWSTRVKKGRSILAVPEGIAAGTYLVRFVGNNTGVQKTIVYQP